MRGEFNRKPAHADTPGKGTVFSQYFFFAGTFTDKKAGIRISPAWGSCR